MNDHQKLNALSNKTQKNLLNKVQVKKQNKTNKMFINNTFKKGHWTYVEQVKYNQGCQIYKGDWKNLSVYVGSRTPQQVRSHNQKMKKTRKSFKYETEQECIHDFLENKEKEIQERLLTSEPLKKTVEISITKELMGMLKSTFGVVVNHDFVLTKDHLTYMELNKLKKDFKASIPLLAPFNGAGESSPHQESFYIQSEDLNNAESVEVDERRLVSESTEMEGNYGLDNKMLIYTASQFDDLEAINE